MPPKNVNGTEINSHRINKVSKVPKGTAPEDRSATKKKFNTKNSIKAIPGNNKAVNKVFDFQFSPLNILYSLEL